MGTSLNYFRTLLPLFSSTVYFAPLSRQRKLAVSSAVTAMVRQATTNVKKYTLTHKSHKRTRYRPRQTRTIMTRSQCAAGGSFFHGLPSEVFNMILDQLSVLEISVFSMVSKEMTRYVVDYISTTAWRNKTIIQTFHFSTLLESKSTIGHYRDLGLLFKRCTLLLPTKERLKFTFSKFSQIPCFLLEQCLTPDCIGFSSYGVFLQKLVAGWDELECHRVFNFLCNVTDLLQKIEAVISGKPEVRLNQKLQVRLFCRQVLLDSWPNQPECQFWLIQLLKPWPMVSQAHLLFILYGPLLPQGILGWQDLTERGLPHTALWDLARAVLLLSDKQEVKGQTANSLLAILEELIVIPQPWHVENVARLLVLCGSSLCYTFLANKAVNGRLHEISRLIVYIILGRGLEPDPACIRQKAGALSDGSLFFFRVTCAVNGAFFDSLFYDILVCEKEGYHMTWAVKIVQQICTVFSTDTERFRFIQHLENMFSEVTREFFEFSLIGNHFEGRETFQTLCILLDSSARFHTKFLHMLLK